MKALLLFICFFLSLFASPSEELVPGGIAKLYFNEKPEIFIDNLKQNLFVQKSEHEWMVLIPISLEQKAAQLSIVSKIAGHEQTHLINIVPKAYPEQHINVTNKEYAKPSAETIKRIQKERLEKRKVLEHFTTLSLNNLTMIKPLNSPLRHDFGRRRFINGIAKNPHSGIDLSGKCGDKVKAALEGWIIVLKDRFYNGNMLFIDHGQGLFTAYSHLAKIYKKDGEWVKQGELIGEVGQSGRATGPHLHWSVYLQGLAVNPELFLEDANL